MMAEDVRVAAARMNVSKVEYFGNKSDQSETTSRKIMPN